ARPPAAPAVARRRPARTPRPRARRPRIVGAPERDPSSPGGRRSRALRVAGWTRATTGCPARCRVGFPGWRPARTPAGSRSGTRDRRRVGRAPTLLVGTAAPGKGPGRVRLTLHRPLWSRPAADRRPGSPPAPGAGGVVLPIRRPTRPRRGRRPATPR